MSELEMKIESQLAAIDNLISLQLNEILQHPEFKELEATWRGLYHLVSESNPGLRVKIKILDVRKRELVKDFERALEFEQSALFRKVYQDEYGVFAGQPYAALIGAYEFSNYPPDISLLEQISKVAAFVQAPFISAVSPAMFGWETFDEIVDAPERERVFERPEYSKWMSFRESESSKYIGLCLPHILLRDPHHLDDPFHFQESTAKEALLWGNAAFAFGACLVRAFNEKSWLGKMSGIDDDGAVEGLYFQTSANKDRSQNEFSLDASVLEWAEGLSNLGFIPLIDGLNPYFFSSHSVNQPPQFETEGANANARAWAKLEYIFAASRFAIYLMLVDRDQADAALARYDHERLLNRWILKYVILHDNASEEARARQPLREARVDVSEIPGSPGQYRAVVYLRPIYRLSGMLIAMRIVVELPNFGISA